MAKQTNTSVEKPKEFAYVNIDTGRKVFVSSTITGGLWEPVETEKNKG